MTQITESWLKANDFIQQTNPKIFTKEISHNRVIEVSQDPHDNWLFDCSNHSFFEMETVTNAERIEELYRGLTGENLKQDKK